MQQRLKFNPHGVVGVVFLVLMFGIAFFLNWNVNWWYFSIAVVLYSVAIISLTLAEERTRARGYVSREFVGFVGSIHKWLLGCHLALLFLAVGLFFPQPWLFFIPSIYGGLAIPFLLLKTRTEEVIGQTTQTAGYGTPTSPYCGYGTPTNPYTDVAQRYTVSRTSIHLHGLIALLLIILMIGAGFLYYLGKNFGKIYAGVYLGCVSLAIMAYIVANILLNQSSPQGLKPQELKLQLGCHVAFILLIVGFVLPLKDVGSVICKF